MMTKHTVLADELYKLSLNLSKFKVSFLSQRTALIRTLSAMHFLVQCISIHAIVDDEAHIIINTLEYTLRTRYYDFATDLLNAESRDDDLSKQPEFLFEQSGILSACIGELCSKSKNYKESARRYIAVLQTNARALLPPTHEAWLSREEAACITKSYLKCD